MLSQAKTRFTATIILMIFVIISLVMSFMPSPTIGPSATSTLVSGVICSPVTSTISAPFTFDGPGTFCWKSNSLGAFIDSWNTTSIKINGIDVTNVWMGSSSYPAQINGFWYISYNGNLVGSHFEAKYR